jgi:hypothetical protein
VNYDGRYTLGISTGPPIPVAWTNPLTNALRDFSTGWTFRLDVTSADDRTELLLTKTAAITGDDTSPNVLIDWTSGDHSTLGAGTFLAKLFAIPTSGDTIELDRTISFVIDPAAA